MPVVDSRTETSDIFALQNAALALYCRQQPRAVRLFDADLNCLWDSCVTRAELLAIFPTRDGGHSFTPEPGMEQRHWPVCEALARGAQAARIYSVPTAANGAPTEYLVRAWMLEGHETPIVAEEIEALSSRHGAVPFHPDDGPALARLAQVYAEQDGRLRKLDADLTHMIAEVGELLRLQNEPPVSLALRLDNPNLQACHQLKPCSRADCPLHECDAPARCWDMHYTGETHGGEPCHDPLRKLELCGECVTFLTATPDPLTRVGENFNRLLSLVQLKYQEAMVAQQQAQQAERLAQGGELILGLAHEIKTPLSVITSRLDCLSLELGALSNEELAADLRVMQEHAVRMRRLLDSVFDMARPRRAQPALLDASAEVDLTLQIMLKALEHAGLTVHVRRTRTPATIRVDRAQFQQLLLNLVMNARDAMPGGGDLTIETRHVSGECAGVEVIVSDSGQGIAAEHLDKIFSPFFSTKLGRGGTGLGLTVCQRVMLHHGGRLLVQSEPGQGATFTAWFPQPGGEA